MTATVIGANMEYFQRDFTTLREAEEAYCAETGEESRIIDRSRTKRQKR